MPLIIDEKKLELDIKKAVEDNLNRAFASAARDIELKLKSLAQKVLRTSPEYLSLSGGVLKDEFSLKDPSIALAEIVSTIQKGIKVTASPVQFAGTGIKGGISIYMIRSDFDDLLRLSSVSYTTSSGLDVEWLNWLLTQGDTILILRHNFAYNPASKLTGIDALEHGGGFRVPPQFSGIISDNWITKTFDVNALRSEVINIIKNSVLGKL